MTKQELLRNQADALDWIEEGRQVQFLDLVRGWVDLDAEMHFTPASAQAIDVERAWRIKPEVRQFQPWILRDWLGYGDVSADTTVYEALPKGVRRCKGSDVIFSTYSKRVIYATREQAGAARKAMGWAG